MDNTSVLSNHSVLFMKGAELCKVGFTMDMLNTI